MVYLQFTVACVLVILSGIALTRYGEKLQDTAGISSGFIGVFLLGAATSLPEFVASFSAIYLVGAPQLSFGNIFGSNVFNITGLVFIDLFFMREILYHKARNDISCIKSIAIGIVLTALAIAGIYLNSDAYLIQFGLNGRPFACVSIFSLLIFVIYLLTLKQCCDANNDDANNDNTTDQKTSAELENKKDCASAIWMKFLLSVIAVLITGVWVTYLSDQIAEVTGLGRTFIGSILLASATSLPEVTVSFTTLKMKRYDLMFGNIFGSNTFNLFILSLTDIFTPHIVMLRVEAVELNLITASAALILSGMMLFLTFAKGSKKQFRVFSAILIALYFLTYHVMLKQQYTLQQQENVGAAVVNPIK